MQRAISVALSIAAVALSAVLAFKSAPGVFQTATASGGEVSRDAGSSPRSGEKPQADAGASTADLVPSPSADVPEGGPRLAEGTGAAPLENGAPKHVRFGVILVTYEGAEGAPERGARHRSDALALATRLADDARADFHGAVARGDNGSVDDVGTVARGVLEPGSEAVLFALPVGGVSGVVDTPRGFWIVKRLE
jgi:hypothetical protein